MSHQSHFRQDSCGVDRGEEEGAAGAGRMAVHLARSEEMNDLARVATDGEREREREMRGDGGSEAYGTFVAGDGDGSVRGSSKDAREVGGDLEEDSKDTWSKIKGEYGTTPKGGVGGLLRRLPPYVLLSLSGLLLVASVTMAILIFPDSRASSSSKPTSKPMVPARAVSAGLIASSTSAPAGASKQALPAARSQQAAAQANLGNAASAAAAAAAAAAARQQVEEKAEEKARRAEKMKEIEAALTPQATDSPMVQASVNKGTNLLSQYTYDSQRVVVAKQNLLPLQQAVAGKQKLYSAEHQEEDKWRAKIESDVALERDAQRSKNAVSERLAQLKVLGKRESQDEPQLRAEIEKASAAEQTAIDARNRFEALEANARQELAETIAAEKKDSSNAVESKAYIAAQLADSKADIKAADSQLPETTRLANKISQISPQVQGLWNEYVRDKHDKIEAGLIKQDKRREEARRNMNGLIRAREKLEQLPRSKAISAKLDALAGKLQGAQQQLGKLYSDQETDKAKLRAKVENEEMKSAIYIRYKAKQAKLNQEQAKLNRITTNADEQRYRAQQEAANAQNARGKQLNEASTNQMLHASEKRLRLKMASYAAQVGAENSKALAEVRRRRVLAKRMGKAKKELEEQTRKGEDYVAKVVSTQEQNAAFEQKIAKEQQAFAQEKMLDEEYLKNSQASELQLQAAEAVVSNLKRQKTLDRAKLWREEMIVKQLRREEMVNVVAQQQQEAMQQQMQQQQMQRGIVQQQQGAGGAQELGSPYLEAQKNVINSAVNAQMQGGLQQPVAQRLPAAISTPGNAQEQQARQSETQQQAVERGLQQENMVNGQLAKVIAERQEESGSPASFVAPEAALAGGNASGQYAEPVATVPAAPRARGVPLGRGGVSK